MQLCPTHVSVCPTFGPQSSRLRKQLQDPSQTKRSALWDNSLRVTLEFLKGGRWPTSEKKWLKSGQALERVRWSRLISYLCLRFYTHGRRAMGDSRTFGRLLFFNLIAYYREMRFFFHLIKSEIVFLNSLYRLNVVISCDGFLKK